MFKKKPFKLPQAFLNNLDEFTNGYYLITINEIGEFETFMNFPSPVSEIALLNFVDVQSTALQERNRQRIADETAGVDDEASAEEDDEGEFS